MIISKEKTPSEEQLAVIDSIEDRIIVVAKAGSGKTYTLTKKIIKDLEKIEDYQGIIACSFTNEASDELYKKISSMTEIKQSYIGTFDSFVLNEIINPFKNRSFKQFELDFQTDKPQIKFSTRKKSCVDEAIKDEDLTKEEISSQIRMDMNNWIDNFKDGVLILGYETYLYAFYMLSCMVQIRDYISYRYKAIYIDEGQDLNFFQNKLLRAIVDFCNLKCVIIGDARQSIYEFRGSKPLLFLEYENYGFKKYELNISYRCSGDIEALANVIIGEKFIKPENIDFNNIVIDYDIRNIVNEEGPVFILCDTKDLVNSYYSTTSNLGFDSICIKKLELPLEEGIMNLINDILCFYYNVYNKENLCYPVDEFIESIYLKTGISLKNEYLALVMSDDSSDFLFNVLNELNIDLEDYIKVKIRNELNNPLIENGFKNFDNVNRVMTIHSSKGLECNVVVLVLKPNYYTDVNSKEYLRKLYVGITRAKKKVGFILRGYNTEDTRELLENAINTLNSKLPF